MKIAKKMLAVVMAIAMIGCLTAMAFAAGTPTLKLVPGEVKDGKVKVAIVAEGCKGLESADLVVKYDANVLKFKAVANGADVKKVLASTNTFSGIGNGTVEGEVKYGFNFLESLSEFPDEEGELIAVDADNFEVAVITFEVKDDAATSTKFELTGGSTGVEATVEAGVTVTLKEEIVTEPTTQAAPATEATEATEAPATKEAATKEANPDTGDVNTGDTMAIAAAAGVVALAGAAFIISKKRK